MDDFTTRQASIKSVLTCRICKKLFKEVTIIEECCHRFCKKCITRTITEEKLHVCPVCNLDLGVAPLQKIRPDHQVQEIRDIFSAKRREYIERGLIQDSSKKGETKKLAHEDNNSDNMLIDNPLPTAAAVATSSRRKEKSISSLVNTTPVDDQVPVQQNVLTTGRRRRSRSRNANNNALRFQELAKFYNVEVNQIKGDHQPGSSNIPLFSGKATTKNKQQVESAAYAAESSKNDTISKKGKGTEPLDGMNDLWEPLNTLVTDKGVTLANSNKSKFTEPVPNFTPLFNLYDEDEEDDDEKDDEEYVPSPKTRERKVSKQNIVHQKEEKKSNVVPAAAAAPSTSNNNNNDRGKGKKGRRGRKKKETNNIPAGGGGGGSSNNVAQVGVAHEAAATSSGTRLNERVNSIWFNLVASDKQECPSPLPQISSRYIKIKDANMPVSYTKKYIALKLSLQSEDEVELRMLGIPLRLPEQPLRQLTDFWLHAAPNSGIRKAKVGGSAKDFVMVFTYGRKS
ncbi:E3 ubiquitin protein ligase DRIP1-like isoform X1 [Lycium ferocissimum]|uniref:E3 ubiquitin protein ligase DRIP1-like isoform X1 n=1 Tax=Lycium ferocissimum TaxID=112874 RepID=UPI00281547DB|nr:E3 ubiquitin protein ligase DRIP1-like isoform X1 [Lycium ferocissimum]